MLPSSRFRDRAQAGRELARSLQDLRGRQDALVLALPRGGVPVGLEIARALDLPLDVFVVRKLGAPGQEELAMGAIATGGVRVLNEDIVRALAVTAEQIEKVAQRELHELERRERVYRGGRPAPEIAGRTVVLVDDGLATGSTMRAAAAALRQQQPAAIVVAVPVASTATCDEFRDEVDRVICALTPEPFFAVGQWYDDFAPVTDEEVRELMATAPPQRAA